MNNDLFTLFYSKMSGKKTSKPQVKDLTVTPFELSLLERMELQFILPREGKYIEMTLAGRIAEMVKVTAQEIKEYELKDVQGGISGKE